MKSRVLGLMVAAVVMAAVAPAWAMELGDKAPALKIDKWVKGDAVEFKDGKIYVVEFWATWCGPCRVTIPHLTDLQKKYKDKNVTVIGVSVDSEKTRAKVEPFVKEQGDKMQYVVAVDKDGATSRAYMDPFKVQGIPEAFVVDAKGKLVWHGHPQMGLGEVLDAVVAGKSDVKELAEIGGKVAAEFEKLLASVDEYFEVARAGTDQAKATELGKSIVTKGAQDANIMNQFAWSILTDDDLKIRDKELALTAAKAAMEASKGENAAVIDTYARALFENGKVKEAIEQQKKAIKLAGDDKDMVKELTEALKKFEAAEAGKADAGEKGAKEKP